MFKKILIANRGEIAVRIIRAARELGIETVAIYSEADRDALHTNLADEAVCVGGPRSKDSYLNVENIISATVLTGAEAIHPGFGFLSENSKFAKMCRDCNIAFIGPSPEIIDKMGNKAQAKDIMRKAGVPIIMGSDGKIDTVEEGLDIAEKMGYPVLIKASAGGGGKGMRLCFTKEEFVKGYTMAKGEALASFGDDDVYVEKFIEEPKHIEFQILGDKFGNVIHLGERDCSVQRRNQKVIEEAPSPVMKEKVRKEMGAAAIKAAKAVNYENAGTIEFLLDKNYNFYFMEMNTRIQVEHGITETVTGIDLVKEQIKIAAGETLNITQEMIKIQGAAIECRINAENPSLDFRPSPGKITKLISPGGPGIRLDSAVYEGYSISPLYDSMIGKLIAYGRDREEAIARMKRALGEYLIEGIDTNIEYQLTILENPVFISGNYNTSFVKNELSNNI
ncbi:MAG: acetyl-CoA carboxylase biotin carboxylase subunit [Bacillota bacterium]|nr:acetyl-CoA carboxylase biotin carboxylase subunit [Bacillota bacterium]